MPGYSPLLTMFPEKKQQLQNLIDKMDLGLITMPEYYALSGELVDMTADEVEKLYDDTFKRSEKSIDWLRGLKKSAKFKICLTSNAGHGRIQDYFSNHELKELFDKVIISSDVGIIKPDPAIYELTTNKLRVKPNECLLVDDKLKNIDAAIKVGMKGILFESVEQSSAELNWLLELSDA